MIGDTDPKKDHSFSVVQICPGGDMLELSGDSGSFGGPNDEVSIVSIF